MFTREQEVVYLLKLIRQLMKYHNSLKFRTLLNWDVPNLIPGNRKSARDVGMKVSIAYLCFMLIGMNITVNI